MRFSILFAAAVLAGASYYLDHWLELSGPVAVLWKGAGVGLLAAWAAVQARRLDGWLIAAALGIGASGDVLLETSGLTVGAIAFLTGHLVAATLYLRNRTGSLWMAAILALGVSTTAFLLPSDRPVAPGIALYALGLGSMMGTAVISRFPKPFVAFGAVLFALSDLLIFARLGPLSGSPLPGLLIWPTYFAGQALIAWGVVTNLQDHRP